MNDKLLPCPFCGNKSAVKRVVINRQPQYRVVCGTCGIMTALDDTAGEVSEAWNRRAVTGITVTDNAPLTLDELRGMDREPVWMEKAQTWCFMCLIGKDSFRQVYYFSPRGYSRTVLFEDEKFYRRKPEDV